MPLITPGLHSISKIPVEIWDEILNLATTVEKGDEFGHHSTLCATLNYGDMIFDCRVPPEDQKFALATRRSVVLVCRAWHQVATRFLWSHLIITTDLRTSESFGPFFRSLSELLCHFKRLDIVQSLEGELEFQKISLTQLKNVLENEIYPQMSNLRILCAPHNLATGNYACSPAIVSLHPPYLGQLDFFELDEREVWFRWDGGKHFWTSTTILDLDMDLSLLSGNNLKARDHIPFSQLKKLRIRFLQSDCIVDHIIQHWKTPALVVLSLRDCYTYRGFDLVAWSSGNVTTLELSSFDLVASTPILMPRLASIIVNRYFYHGWEDLIQAPSLKKLSFSDTGAERLYQTVESLHGTWAGWLNDIRCAPVFLSLSVGLLGRFLRLGAYVPDRYITKGKCASPIQSSVKQERTSCCPCSSLIRQILMNAPWQSKSSGSLLNRGALAYMNWRTRRGSIISWTQQC